MKSKGFKKLQSEWYSKLKDEGFEDIEYLRDGEPGEWLKGNSKFASEEAALSMSLEETDEADIIYSTTFDYYSQAAALLHTAEFESDIHQRVWEMHSEGLSYRKIGKAVGFSHPKVMRMVDKIKAAHFGINK